MNSRRVAWSELFGQAYEREGSLEAPLRFISTCLNKTICTYNPTKNDPAIFQSIVPLFSHIGKPIPGAPWLKGQQPIPPAGRKVAKGDTSPDTLSYSLAKGLAAVLSGKVKEFGATVPTEEVESGIIGVTIESTSDPGRHNHCGIDLARKALLFPHSTTTYHLGVIGLCEAILRYVAKRGSTAGDLVTSYGELLRLLDAGKDLPLRETPAPSLATQEQMQKTCAELYYWLFYEDGAAIGKGASKNIRLYEYEKELSPAIWDLKFNLAHVLTDYAAFQTLISSHKSGPTAAPKAPVPPGRKFRGWQYDELKRAILLGLSVSCIGPSSTGKSICILDLCRNDLKIPVFTINALGDRGPKDLIGGYAKNGTGDWHFVPGKIVRAAEAANSSDKAVVFVDEAGHLSEKAQSLFLKCLSDDRMLDMSEFGLPDVSLANVVFVFAGNYGDGYGANPAIYSLLSRQDVVLDFHYMDRHDEIEWLRSETGLPANVATALVDIARETRIRHLNQGKFKYLLDPRGLLAWARLIAAAEELTADTIRATARTWYPKIANLTSTSNADPEEVAELEKIVGDFTKRL